MDDKKRDAPAVQEQDASTQNASSTNIIPQSRRRFKGDKTHVLSAQAKVKTLAVKCYAEQLPNGEQCLIDNIKATDKRVAEIMAIKHDRDIVTDGIWLSSTVKPHWHIILRLVPTKARIRVLQLMHDLGIYFRPGTDDELWINHGVETVGNFAGYALYLTHETEDAIREGKELYDRADVVSNLSMDEQDQIRAGYIKVSEKRKATLDELVALDKEAYDIGFALRDFRSWYNSQPFTVRADGKMKVIRESYNSGVQDRIERHEPVDRLCVYIQGDANKGKTFAAVRALMDMGLSVLTANGGGTGKFDGLRADHDAIVFDDCKCPNLLNMADGYICIAYRRQSNNPPWTGKYLIVTSNLTFWDWLEQCGLHVKDYNGNLTRHGKAMQTRFIVGEIVTDAAGISRLVVHRDGINLRGNADRQQRLVDMFAEFKRRYNTVIRDYVPTQGQVDFSGVVDDDAEQE